MKRIKSLYIIMFLLLPLFGFSQNRSEYTIKAVLIEKITRFIDWPGSIPEKCEDPFIICVIGTNPFNDILDNIYSYQKIKDRNVEIKYINSINEIENTDLLYITKSKENEINRILEFAKSKPILIFSESKGFAQKGVHVNFLIKNNKIRFEINETSLRDSDFHISFRLLSQAIIVNPLNE